MSGAEVIGLISGIISIVDAAVKVYTATTNASGLPEAFHDVAKRLPLVHETLQTAGGHLNTTNPDEAFYKAMKPVLEGCKDKATRLAEIFEKAIPHADASRMERYLLAARTLGKGSTVESLMKGILDDVQLLAGNRVTKLATEAEIGELIRAAREVSAIPTSLPGGFDSSLTCDAERDALLKELKWTDPTIDKLRIERTKGGLYEASSSWILAHPTYHKWRHDDTKLLWIKGGASKGKTMLLVGITKELRPHTKLDNPSADSIFSFFFCQNTDDRLNYAVAILKGLIYLLLVQDSSLVSYLKNDYDRMGKELFDVSNNNVNAFDALSNVFRQMIQHPRSETVYLAVDALDECEDGLPDLLGLIRETSLQENSIKWIVTSRNRVDIDESLALNNPEAKLSLEVNSEAVSRAIEVYIDHKVSQVPSLKSNPGRRANVQKKLLDKADGTFLWVDLILRTIHGALGDDIVRLIDEIPSGLPPLYDRMMGDIGMSTSAYRDPCLVILSIAALAYRPLHVLELRILAGLEKYDTADLERIVDMCVNAVAFSPDGSRIASGSGDNTVRVWDAKSGREVRKLEGHSDSVNAVAFSPDGSRIASGSGDNTGRIASGSGDNTVRVWDAKSGREVRKLGGHSYWVNAVAFSPDGSRIASGSYDNTVRVWDIKLGREVRKLEGHSSWVSSVAFSPDGSRIASGSGDNTVRVWDAKSGREVHKLEGHSDSVNAVAFSLDGSRIASGSDDKTVRVWDTKLGRKVNAVAFSPDGSRIASGSDDKTVRVWDTKLGRKVRKLKVRKLEGHRDWVNAVAFSPDGSRIASGSDDKTVRVWDTKSGREVRKLEGHSSWVNAVAFSPDGSRIASGSYDKTVRVWDIKLGREVRKLEGHHDSVRSVAFSPDGSCIASGSDDDTVRVWDAKSGREVCKLEGHSSWVRSVAFSPDGSRIASGSDDNTVGVWDIKLGREVRKLEGYRGSVNAVFRLRFESSSDSGLRLQANADGIDLDLGSSSNHGGRNSAAINV
ncbi:hypothetical protein ACJ41O_008748 [Fusarium nematophilum]